MVVCLLCVPVLNEQLVQSSIYTDMTLVLMQMHEGCTNTYISATHDTKYSVRQLHIIGITVKQKHPTTHNPKKNQPKVIVFGHFTSHFTEDTEYQEP